MKDFGLLDVSCGFQHGTRRAGDHVDHGDESLSVTVTACPGSGHLEQAIEPLHACIGIGGCPAPDDPLCMGTQGMKRLAHRFEQAAVAYQPGSVVDEASDAPSRGPGRLGLAYPFQSLLDPPGRRGIEPLGKQFTQGVELVDRQMIGNRVLQHRPAGMFG